MAIVKTCPQKNFFLKKSFIKKNVERNNNNNNNSNTPVALKHWDDIPWGIVKFYGQMK